jgi:hypothetical protein
MEATHSTYDIDEQLDWYKNENLKLVRVSRATKKPVDSEWQHKEVPIEEIIAWVARGGNVGVQVGEVSDWICGVDLDCREAELMAPSFYPETLKIRKGAGTPSVYVFRSPGLGYAQFNDLSGERVIDVKASENGAGHQFVVEPSVHPTKGAYTWVGGFNPAAIAEVPKEELRRRTSHLAVATLIARSLPDGGRHHFAMALAGYLLRNGLSPEDVLKILMKAWDLKAPPREAFQDLQGIVRDTDDRLQRNEPVTGGTTLGEILPGLPRRIAKFLGLEQIDYSEATLGRGPVQAPWPELAE